MPKHKINGRLSLDGVIYEAGETVTLTAEQAVELAHLLTGDVPTLEDDAPKTGGESKPAPTVYGKMTKPQLVALLTERGAEFDPNAKNDDLKALLEEMDAKGDAPETPTGEENAPAGENAPTE